MSRRRLLARQKILAQAVAKGKVSAHVAHVVERLIASDLANLERCGSGKECREHKALAERVRKLLERLRKQRRRGRRH